MVILVDSHPRHRWLIRALTKRLREELAKLRVDVNEDKSRTVDLVAGGSFSFLGFEYRLVLSRNKKWRPQFAPKLKKRMALFAESGALEGCSCPMRHINLDTKRAGERSAGNLPATFDVAGAGIHRERPVLWQSSPRTAPVLDPPTRPSRWN
jgi:hypothetical protein